MLPAMQRQQQSNQVSMDFIFFFTWIYNARANTKFIRNVLVYYIISKTNDARALFILRKQVWKFAVTTNR